MARKKKKALTDYIPSIELEDDTKRSLWMIVWVGLGVVGYLGLLNMAGLMGNYIYVGLEIAFGWGRWIFPAVLIGIGVFYYFNEWLETRWINYVGLIIFLLSVILFMQLMIDRDAWEQTLNEGAGGGYLGVYMAGTLIKYVGFYLALMISIAVFLVSLTIIFKTSLSRLIGRESVFAKILSPIALVFGKLFNREDDEEESEEEPEEENEENEEEDEGDEEENNEEEHHQDDEESEEADEPEDEEEDKPEFKNKKVKGSKGNLPASSGRSAKANVWQPSGMSIHVPLSLLSDKKYKAASGDVENSKRIIKSTLEKFGIPLELGDESVGPAVTQFTFKPAEGIKLTKITSLSNDLALALAAHPIRIEAPIPGKSLVGVEVPNQKKAIVGLKEVLESQSFGERKTNLCVALGNDVTGKSWTFDISKAPHMLVAGATNSGKSVCLNAIIASLLYQNNPDELKMILVDPKGVEMMQYRDLPYLVCPVITDVKSTILALKWCQVEMERRFSQMQEKNCRDIKDYNKKSKSKIPYLVLIIDELNDLMTVSPKEIEAGITRLAQKARAAGIHLIIATQRPSVDVITGVIKANLPTRIAFSVTSGTDSRTILDTLGAEKLLGRGDMLFKAIDMAKPTRLQGVYVSDDEIEKITDYVRENSEGTLYVDELVQLQNKLKNAANASMNNFGLDGDGDVDELLEQAKEEVINSGRASTSLLQRKFRIGYSRAAAIIDQLESMGIVGPANGSKPREILVSKDEYEKSLAHGTSGVSLHNRKESKAPENYLGEESETPPVLKDSEDADDDKEEFEITDEDHDGIDDEFEEEILDNQEENEDNGEENEEEEDFGKYSAK